MILLYLILTFLIFYITNYYILNNNYECFNKLSNGLLCGTKGNECMVQNYGKNSCCDGYDCIRPNGDYHNRVCVEKNNGSNLLDGIINIPELNSGNISTPGIKYVENNVSTVFNNAISDIKGAFSGVGSYFNDLKIDMGGACHK